MKSYKSLNLRLACTAGALAMMTAAPVTTQAQDVTVDEIIVTGSRIARDPNLVAPTPVQSLSSEDLTLSGEINLAEIVNDIPALISSTTGENSVSGANALNLRGLGANRTLTLVNGRRHVAGFRGTSAVDTGSIPTALVKSVEVITGGASAVYGSDAVTGVVNFILKDDFEGVDLNVRGGISGEGDAENYTIDALFGKNFGDSDQGNIVFSASYVDDSTITYDDRSWSRNNGIATNEPAGNPDLIFQPGELNENTPNFNAQFDTYGSPILSGDYDGLTLTAAEQALLDRATNAPALALINDASFWLSSQAGSIAPSFGGRSQTYVDLNNNGIADCQESRGGQTGFLAGCWVTDANGNARVFEEGQIVTGNLWGTGGDGSRLVFGRDTLYPETDTLSLNLNSKYDFSNNVTAFFEAKYVNAESRTFAEQDTFYDTLFIQADNPFIPANLLPVVAETGGLLLTQDPLDFTDNNDIVTERETVRVVGGLEWTTDNGMNFEVSANHGRFKNTQRSEQILLDRQFAALDAVIDPDTNEAVCRSDLDPTARYEIDYFSGGNGFAGGSYSSDRYYTFTPGDGQCQPLNPFGVYSASAAAQDFINDSFVDELELTQTVLSGIVTGEFDNFQNFLDGAIGYAAGVEYRRESSDNRLDTKTLGILPEGTSFTPGVNVNTVDSFLNSYTSIDNEQQFNTSGRFSVREVFAEASLPILRDKPFAEELSVDAAVRYADYSTTGGNTTWKVGGSWSPISDISFRATVSEAVRAPNVTELFDPLLPITVAATADPCDPGNVTNGGAFVEANCIADLQAAGVDLADIVDPMSGNYIWVNPLTGRFGGRSGGNPDLDAETSKSFTIGAVIQPSFVDNLSFTVDYWDIEIEDGISTPVAVDELEACLRSESFSTNPAPSCSAYTRGADGGLTNIDVFTQNFASIEASGVDFAANYKFDWAENTFGMRLVGSYQNKLDLFTNPADLTDVNPELKEVQRPELSGNMVLSWERGPAYVGFQTSYQSEQSVDEIEDVESNIVDGVEQAFRYGNAGFFDETYIFDANARYEFNDQFSLYGGVNNLSDEQPFSTQTAWPVGPRGRFFFIGANYKM